MCIEPIETPIKRLIFRSAALHFFERQKHSSGNLSLQNKKMNHFPGIPPVSKHTQAMAIQEAIHFGKEKNLYGNPSTSLRKIKSFSGHPAAAAYRIS